MSRVKSFVEEVTVAGFICSAGLTESLPYIPRLAEQMKTPDVCSNFNICWGPLAILYSLAGFEDFGSIEEVQPDCSPVLINTKLIDDSDPLSIQNNIKSWKECCKKIPLTLKYKLLPFLDNRLSDFANLADLCKGDFGKMTGCKYWTWYDTAPYEQDSPYYWETNVCELRASYSRKEKLEGAWTCTDRKNDWL